MIELCREKLSKSILCQLPTQSHISKWISREHNVADLGFSQLPFSTAVVIDLKQKAALPLDVIWQNHTPHQHIVPGKNKIKQWLICPGKGGSQCQLTLWILLFSWGSENAKLCYVMWPDKSNSAISNWPISFHSLKMDLTFIHQYCIHLCIHYMIIIQRYRKCRKNRKQVVAQC